MSHKQEQKSYLADAINAFSPWSSRSPTPKSAQNVDKDDPQSNEGGSAYDGTSTSSAAAAMAGITSAALKASDHSISHWHALAAKNYPKDCPVLNVRWFHAVDVALRRPKYTYQTPTVPDEKSPPAPKKWEPFSTGDSSAIEKAFQQLAEQDQAHKEVSQSSAGKDSVQAGPNSPSVVESSSENMSGKPHIRPNRTLSSTQNGLDLGKVPVNEDYLFDVDIMNRELGPAYWLGPVYAVRRGTWFFVEGTTLKPCDENLAFQLEEGYLKTKPWELTPPEALSSTSQTDGKADISASGSPKLEPAQAESPKSKGHSQSHSTPLTHRLFGSHMGSVVTYQDQSTAWLLSDDFLSRMSSSVYQRFAGAAHLSGTKVLRGFQNISKKPASGKDGKKASKSIDKGSSKVEDSAKTSSQEPPSVSNTESVGSNASNTPDPSHAKEAPESQRKYLERQMSNLVISGYQPDLDKQDEEARKREEQEIRDDYRDTPGDDQDRDIEHVILVTHGIGQRLGARFETFNFIHDVNQLRKTVKQVYSTSEDLQALNEETNKPTKNCKIQVLPICWRHLLDFPHQKLNSSKDAAATSDGLPDEFSSYPSLEDITVDGVPALRGILVDLALDILLYQTPVYHEHISKMVVMECNRILALFKRRNPKFKGKVSLMGHSLGSAVYFDLLSIQSDDRTVFNEFSRRRVLSDKELTLDFDVENLICVGSPLGLFQMLNGKKIAGRSNPSHVTLDGSKDSIEDPFDGEPFGAVAQGRGKSEASADTLVTSPKCKQLYNIFHPTDPVSYRLEPLISPSMASLQPQNLPYTKGGFLGAPIGHGLTGIPAKFGQSMSDLWSSFSSGITNNFIHRSLGVSAEEAARLTASTPMPAPTASSQTKGQPVEAGAGTNIVAGGVIPLEYQSPVTSPTPVDDDRKHRLAMEAAAAGRAGEHPPTLIDSDLETLYAGFRSTPKTDPDGNENASSVNEWRQSENRATRLKREETKVRALNSNGRVDYSIQEGVFDISFLQSIASHLTYWTDEDVCHFIVSQLLSQQRVLRKTKTQK